VERAVGVFVSVATLLLLAGFAYYVYHTGERKGWWTFKARYHTFVDSGAGLGVGGDVKLLGFSVGKITEVTAMEPFSSYGAV
jgi:ABC-type transporter Mla subunit MlaD